MRYVAVGDRFTEGVGDELGDGGVRGWDDLLAGGLAAATAGPVAYANLAVRGRLLEQIVTEQVPAALALDPDARTGKHVDWVPVTPVPADAAPLG